VLVPFPFTFPGLEVELELDPLRVPALGGRIGVDSRLGLDLARVDS
jgi:hypothetical protein